ncbi:MAG: UDP-N-acetylmuramate--L-alanine ligase [Candidatus Eisenbacteria bacterium]|uniref:UDP-N-acetylmuramate--L-alanine ligase n=1 Tax=Eiseniibacteriota bacterium TaxID=2212470 RepID=A0A956NDF3_UNCEI|nr:UDP-N-acetylmuramate--L-alanine ligase [Candidatus Eisenbacteria bacterium]
MSPAQVERIHFVGIGGTGMSGLAEVLLTMGYRVSGSDLSRSEVTERLERLGAHVVLGHRAENVDEVDLVVHSSAIGASNPERRRARARGIAVLGRGEMLAEIMRLRRGIAVAGSHGKTTTTSLVGHILDRAGLEPTVIVGGQLKKIGSNASVGKGDYLVAEADESDGSFLDLSPRIAVITNIDREHLDHYKSLLHVRKAFAKFMRRVPFYGLAVVCGDDPNVRAILPQMRKRVLTYGFGEDNRLRATELQVDGLGQSFRVVSAGESLGRAHVSLPGRHNVLNALASIAVGLEVGIQPEKCLEALDGFAGVGRRFEVYPEVGGVVRVDDYGHHPTEIAAALSAARSVYPDRRLVVLFQPHRYTRTQALAREFAEVLAKVDVLCLTDIYPGGEKPIPGVDTSLIEGPLRSLRDVDAIHVATEADVLCTLPEILRSGDVFLTLGAGSVSRWGTQVLDRLVPLPNGTEAAHG